MGLIITVVKIRTQYRTRAVSGWRQSCLDYTRTPTPLETMDLKNRKSSSHESVQKSVLTNGFVSSAPIFGFSAAGDLCHVPGYPPSTTHFHWIRRHEIPPEGVTPPFKTMTNSLQGNNRDTVAVAQEGLITSHGLQHSFVSADASEMFLFKTYRAGEVGLETQCTFNLALGKDLRVALLPGDAHSSCSRVFLMCFPSLLQRERQMQRDQMKSGLLFWDECGFQGYALVSVPLIKIGIHLLKKKDPPS